MAAQPNDIISFLQASGLPRTELEAQLRASLELLAGEGKRTNGAGQLPDANLSTAQPATSAAAQGFHQGTLPNQDIRVVPIRKANHFAKAVKYNAKGRVALTGPPGSGKSFTALVLARALAGPNGRIAAIDTEHGSLSKYADLFDFDVVELETFGPRTFVDELHAAEEAGYDVFLCDSLSHFWMGKDGALEYVDAAKKRSKDQMEAWKQFRPHEREMVEAMIASPCHVICTMRTKTEFQEQIDDKGKKKRVKIGLAPVQRDGLEYEFDLVGYMDEENTFIADKTRCPAYAQKAFAQPGPKDFAPFVEWLKGTQREPRPSTVNQPIDTGGHPMGTAVAAQYVAEQKLKEMKTSGEIKRAFAKIHELLDEFEYLGVLAEFGVTSADRFSNTETARAAYRKMLGKLSPEARAVIEKGVA